MLTCEKCGKTVSYKTINGKRFLVEGNPQHFKCFIPDKTCKTSFVSRQGFVQYGYEATDGQYGYQLHKCPKKKESTLQEKLDIVGLTLNK